MMDVGGFFFDFDRDAPRRRLGKLDGARYVVLNELRIGSRVLKVRSVFNRVDEVGG